MIDTTVLQPQIADLARKRSLSFVVLFGSQATGSTHPKSDIDIAVISKNNIDKCRIASDFEDIFKREDVEVVNLANASPTLMHEVVKDGKLLFEDREGEFLKWKLYAIWVWMDTQWLRNLGNKKLIEWAKTV
jgi:predicted nucleotidyltransferase